MVYNSKKIAITINGIGYEFLGTDMPTVAKSGDYSEVKNGVNGNKHSLAINGVYNIITLNLKYNSPNLQALEDLAETNTEFMCSYKDGNTNKVINSNNAIIRAVGDIQGDNDRSFTIDML